MQAVAPGTPPPALSEDPRTKRARRTRGIVLIITALVVVAAGAVVVLSALGLLGATNSPTGEAPPPTEPAPQGLVLPAGW